MKRGKLGNFLIGSYSARIDKSGRIKIPERFRLIIETQYGKELFITSQTDQSVQIYPLAIWEEIAGLTNQGLKPLLRDVKMFLIRAHLKGSPYEIDTKGRVLISQALRDKAKLEDEVEVIGMNNHLEVWNKDIVHDLVEQNPLTDEDFERIAELLPKGTKE